jgi:Protein of unknown function (DUF4054)
MSSGFSPDWSQILEQWWGGSFNNYTLSASLLTAANLTGMGGNPPYQLSDFLNVYPKFGTSTQSVVNLSLSAAGANYTVGDALALVQTGASGARVQVLAVSGTGAVTTFVLTDGGVGYAVASGLVTTGGTGAGAAFNVIEVSVGDTVVPPFVLQMFINLANASLQQSRWLDTWPFAMSLFVAHFATLYLRSEGNPGTTPGQIAASGLEKGIAISKAAGDVSYSSELVKGLDEWATWAQTSYGAQLATFAKAIGAGGMYVHGM